MKLDIVMYHYVRPIKESKFPRIRGLELRDFRNQLDFFLKEKNIISTNEVINAIRNSSELPENSIWLTFDDGYKDHFDFVAPILEEKGINAAFFPVSNTYQKNHILDVNKIHYILASIRDDKTLIENLFTEMKFVGYKNSDLKNLWSTTDKSSRFDTEEVIFFKRMLQRDLPKNLREKILKRLFEKIVGLSEKEMSNELYMTKNELISLNKRGFSIGSHTSSHIWLDSVKYQKQEDEIKNSLEALKEIRGDNKNWIMSYPYGAYNDDTLSILEKQDCVLALTTKVGAADLKNQNKFELKRWDTNDFKQHLST